MVWIWMRVVSIGLAVGCARTIAVPKAQLPEVMTLARGGSIQIHRGAETVTIAPADSPRLVIEVPRRCSWLRYVFAPRDCAAVHRVPIGSVAFDGTVLHARERTGSLVFGSDTDAVFPLGNVRSLAIEYDPADRRPAVGVGFTALGPSRFAGPELHVLPRRWLAVELGVGGAPDLGGLAWLAMRIRPIAIGKLRPFVGTFANYASYVTPDEPHDRWLALGARTGIDLELARGHVVLTFEADAVRTRHLDGAREVAWSPSGGVACSYLF